MNIYETMTRKAPRPTEYYYDFEGIVQELHKETEAVLLLDNGDTTTVDLWAGQPFKYKSHKSLKRLIGKRIKVIDAWRFRYGLWLTNKAEVVKDTKDGR